MPKRDISARRGEATSDIIEPVVCGAYAKCTTLGFVFLFNITDPTDECEIFQSGAHKVSQPIRNLPFFIKFI